ncbi:MAG: translation elongation factor Ts [Sphaerochaetaceae bacterium]|nr:translation elongation factor Ts [Sphaerochaetaceae bacterium]
MEIKAATVKKLRDATGAGMMDCKKALVAAEGDFALAEKHLKEMGLAAVAKRADRATENGRIFTKITPKKAVLLELTCETDFVSGNEDFAKLGEDMIDVIIEKNYTSINEELELMVKNLIAVIKENMTVKNVLVFDLADNDFATTYIHGAGEKGVLVEFKADKAEAFENEEIKEFCHDCALHVAAFTPTYLKPSEIPQADIDELTGIFTKQAQGMGKPEKIIPNIVKGMLNKNNAQVCFLQQAFVKDDKMSVEAKMKQVAKAAGFTLEITGFQMFSVGA